MLGEVCDGEVCEGEVWHQEMRVGAEVGFEPGSRGGSGSRRWDQEVRPQG